MKKILLILITSILVLSSSFAQNNNRSNQPSKGGSINGKVIDSATNQAIEYANLVLLNSSDTTQVNGTITDTEGNFKLTGIKQNQYILKISFIGYESHFFNDIVINNTLKNIDLGEIELNAVAYEIEGAEVIANRTPVEYHIDKKVINVSEQSTSISGTAVEVLENVPSVNVDIEGNVSLRGSGSFTLLIDGRPTILDPNDALEQIPASTIDNIEIVTNPSAKYDPEGVSGIINIIMKKNQFSGMSGVLNGHVGLDNKYGFDFTGSYKNNGSTFYLSGSLRDDSYKGTGKDNRVTFNDEFKSFLNSTRSGYRTRQGYNIRGGADFNLDNFNQLGISFRFRDRTNNRNYDILYHEFTSPPTDESYYENKSKSERSGKSFSSYLNYKHIFGEKDHNISFDFSYQKSDDDEFTINEYYDENNILYDGRKNTEAGPEDEFEIKIDYTLPINKNSRFEAGFETEIENSEGDIKSMVLNTTNGDYIVEEDYSYLVKYKDNYQAFYSIYNSKFDKFGYQLGLRTEYTDRLVEIPDSNQNSTINRWDYFPTIHTSYSFNELVEIMASYTKRIRRPRGYYLEPFLTWQDQNNVRQGNPDLEAEYINSFELAYKTHIEDVILSLEGYFRERNNKIERVQAVYDTNATITTFNNVGTDYTLGAEFMMDAAPYKFWNFNLMGNISRYKLEGTYEGNDYSRKNTNWGVRINNTFMLTESTKLQINGRYNGPSISSQGDYKGYYSTDMALKQEMWSKKLALTLQVRDIFQTSKREGTNFGPGFESYMYRQRKSPIVILNISINLNNFRQKRNSNNNNGDFGEEEM